VSSMVFSDPSNTVGDTQQPAKAVSSYWHQVTVLHKTTGQGGTLSTSE
jgi:hypothetical protein